MIKDIETIKNNYQTKIDKKEKDLNEQKNIFTMYEEKIWEKEREERKKNSKLQARLAIDPYGVSQFGYDMIYTKGLTADEVTYIQDKDKKAFIAFVEESRKQNPTSEFNTTDWLREYRKNKTPENRDKFKEIIIAEAKAMTMNKANPKITSTTTVTPTANATPNPTATPNPNPTATPKHSVTTNPNPNSKVNSNATAIAIANANAKANANATAIATSTVNANTTVKSTVTPTVNANTTVKFTVTPTAIANAKANPTTIPPTNNAQQVNANGNIAF